MITPTMMNKGEIKKEDLVLINKKGDMLEGTRRPAGENSCACRFLKNVRRLIS